MALLINDAVDLLLDANNDLVITSDLQFSRGIQAVAQSCRIALQLFTGEWFLDLNAGIPYWQNILAQKPAVAIKAARVAFRAELQQVNGVDAVKSLDVEYDRATRGMNNTFAVTTVFGDSLPQSIAVGPGAVSGSF